MTDEEHDWNAEAELARKFAREADIISSLLRDQSYDAAQHRTQNLLVLLQEKTGKKLIRSRGGGVYE